FSSESEFCSFTQDPREGETNPCINASVHRVHIGRDPKDRRGFGDCGGREYGSNLVRKKRGPNPRRGEHAEVADGSDRSRARFFGSARYGPTNRYDGRPSEAEHKNGRHLSENRSAASAAREKPQRRRPMSGAG